MNTKRINQYDSEIASWLSKQTIFYQIFNCFKIVGFTGSAVAYFFGVLIKLCLILLLVAALIFLYFARQHNNVGFSEKTAKKISRSLNAEKVKLPKLKGGIFSPVEIQSMKATGTENSFFETLDIYNIKMDLGTMAFKTKNFSTQSVDCTKIDTKVRISAAPGTEKMYSSLFDTKGWFRFRNLDTRFFNCEWGYSKNSKGQITDAKMALQKSDKRCEITLTGGTLSYSWLKKVNIERMKLILTPEHFIIQEAVFRRDNAVFTLEMKVESFGELPVVKGTGEIINCDIHDLIAEEFKPYIGGVVHSSYEFSGSPNAINGMDFTFKPLENASGLARNIIEEDAYFKFTYDLPLIKALGAVDRSINYRGLKFTKNNWELEIKNGEIFARDITLGSYLNQINIKTQFALKPPTQEYIDATMNSMKQRDYIRLLQRPWLEETGLEMIELKKSIDDQLGASSLTYGDYVKLLQTEKHFYGDCLVKFHKRSFTGKEVLQDTYPVNKDEIRTMEVPLNGHIKQLTKSLANDLYYLSHKIK